MNRQGVPVLGMLKTHATAGLANIHHSGIAPRLTSSMLYVDRAHLAKPN